MLKPTGLNVVFIMLCIFKKQTDVYYFLSEVTAVLNRECVFMRDGVINEKHDSQTEKQVFEGENRFPRVHLGHRPYRLFSRSRQTRIRSRHATGALSENLWEKTNTFWANGHIPHAAVRGTVMEERDELRNCVWSQMAVRNTARARL